ncbi:MAG: histidine phosphatase family protein [Spirochaetes bacterium]|nr:histidine phosphatase family protein [Spirochaetota bacterium]
MTNLFLIRHAESDLNIKDQYSRPLTSKGEIDSINLINLFKNIDVDALYTSPYKRSIDTIKHIAEIKNKKIIISENLCERRIGSWVPDFFEYSKKQWNDFNYKLEGGESLAGTQDRIISNINEILIDHQNQNILIGTHCSALCMIINKFDPDFGYDDFLKIVDKMPYIIKLEFNGENYIKREIIEFISEYDMIS